MNFSKINPILLASTLAVIALIFIQVRWMQKSHDLLEEQFNNRVKTALCSAVESLDNNTSIQLQNNCVKVKGVTENNIDELNLALSRSLSFYDIDLPFQIELSKEKAACDMLSCSVSPLENGTEMVTVDFPDKERYIFSKMGFMLVMSIIILLFVLAVLLAANRALFRQKRISEINIDFFNNLAHEFRTPLTSIKLATSLFKKKQPLLADNKFIHIIRRESEQLSGQVDRVLHLAKMERNEYQLEKEPIQIEELITATIQEMEMHIKAKNAQITIEKESVGWIEGDRFHLKNAFRNLIDNALKYSKGEPIIHIHLKNHPKGIQVIFQDNGVGISKNDQELVFDKYHRVKTGNPHEQKGFGLGLAYVKMIIERHQGIVQLVSELKVGSRFDLFFPIQGTNKSLINDN